MTEGERGMHHNSMVNFLEYVSSQERKRRVRTASAPKEKMPPPEQKRGSLVCGTVKTPIGSRVAKIKSRVLKRITKNDSAIHKVRCQFLWKFEPSTIMSPNVNYLIGIGLPSM